MTMKNLASQGFPNYAVTYEGHVWSIKSERFLKSVEMRQNGYHIVTLHGKTVRVHRIVQQAFDPIPTPDDFQVNHIDGDKSNNCKSNLEWCNAKENSIHAVRTGLNPVRGQEEETIHSVCKLIEDGWRNKDIADALGLSVSYISNIKGGWSGKYISDEYDFSVRKNNKYSVEKIRKVCELLQEGKLNSVEISELLNISVSNIRNIKCRRIHKYISKNYSW